MRVLGVRCDALGIGCRRRRKNGSDATDKDSGARMPDSKSSFRIPDSLIWIFGSGWSKWRRRVDSKITERNTHDRRAGHPRVMKITSQSWTQRRAQQCEKLIFGRTQSALCFQQNLIDETQKKANFWGNAGQDMNRSAGGVEQRRGCLGPAKRGESDFTPAMSAAQGYRPCPENLVAFRLPLEISKPLNLWYTNCLRQGCRGKLEQE